MWKNVKVGDVAKVVGGNGFPKKYQLNTNKLIPFYKVSDMNIAGNEIEMYSANSYVDDEDLKEIKAKWHPSGTIIFPKIGGAISTNKKRILKSKAAFDNNIMGVIPNKSEILPEFLYKIFLSLDLYELSNKANPPSIINGAVENIEFLLPSLEEQQRIVAKLNKVFANIDMAIKSNKAKLEQINKLETAFIHKELYSNENDKDFTKTNVGRVCNLMTGGTPSRKRKEYFEGGKIPWLVSGDIHKKIILDCEGMITEDGYKNSNAKYLPINSVMIALNGQGKTRGTVAILKIKATCNQSLVSIYPKKEVNLNTNLLFHMLNVKYEELRKITGDSGNDRRGLNMPLIREIKIAYPNSLEAQENIVTKINNFLENKIIALQKLNKITNEYNILKTSILSNHFLNKAA